MKIRPGESGAPEVVMANSGGLMGELWKTSHGHTPGALSTTSGSARASDVPHCEDCEGEGAEAEDEGEG